jgi:hypothetical protein
MQLFNDPEKNVVLKYIEQLLSPPLCGRRKFNIEALYLSIMIIHVTVNNLRKASRNYNYEQCFIHKVKV